MFPGGKFKVDQSIFQRLEEIVEIPEEDRYYKYHSVFDFEALQVEHKETLGGRETHYTHVPVSYSVCSNIPGHTEPVHISSDDPQFLIDSMVTLQLEHQETASKLTREKFKHVFNQLNEEIEAFQESENFEKLKTMENITKVSCAIL